MGAKTSPVTDAEAVHLGEDRVYQFTVTDKAGNAVDITGFTLDWKLFDDEGGLTLLTLSMATGDIAITNGPAGIYQVTTKAAATAGLTSGRLFYKTRRIDTGFFIALAKGTFAMGPT